MDTPAPLTEPPVACTLTPEQLHCAAAELLPGLAEIAKDVRRTADGVHLDFDVTAGLIPRIAAVIDRERQCCQFLRFELAVAEAAGPVTLSLSGPEGTGAFLESLHPAFDSALTPGSHPE